MESLVLRSVGGFSPASFVPVDRFHRRSLAVDIDAAAPTCAVAVPVMGDCIPEVSSPFLAPDRRGCKAVAARGTFFALSQRS